MGSSFKRFIDGLKSLSQKHPFAAISAVTGFALLLVLLRASILNYQYLFGMYHDDGVYLVSAQSLLDGHGYRILSLPTEPFQTKYPVGYPLVLSSAMLIMPAFPANLIGLETMQTVLSVAAVLVTVGYLLSTKKVTPLLGLAIAFTCLLNMRFIDFAPMLMSDLPAALLVSACMWCAESQSRQQDSFSPWVGLLLAAAITTRTQALILVPTLLIYYAVRKRTRSAITMLAIALVCVVPQMWWQTRTSQGTPEILTFYTNYLKHAYGTLPSSSAGFAAAAGNFDWSMFVQINTYFPGLEQIPYQLLSPIAFFLLYKVVYYLLAVPSLTGMFILLKRASLPALFCFFYGFSFSLWPIKLEWRHILPVLVFGYYFYFVGFRFFAAKLKRAISARKQTSAGQYSKFCIGATVVFSCYLVIGAGVLSCAKAGWLKALSQPPEPGIAVDFQEAVSWIKANTTADAVFVCNNDPVFYLYTHRHAIMPSRMELWRFVADKYVDAKSLSAAIEFSKATYVMNEPALRSSGYAYTQLNKAIAEEGTFIPVFKTKNNLIEIFKVSR
ncbi:MAG: hypothetical protein JST89_03160 [Cyanobacteria bacterium SZAS-4]|nr:hypothetical protein [Cyanobacteria bacterium SZAS-4]